MSSEALLGVALPELNFEISESRDEWQRRVIVDKDAAEAERKKIKIVRSNGVQEESYNDAEMSLWLLADKKSKEVMRLSEHYKQEVAIDKLLQESIYLRHNLILVFRKRTKSFGCKFIEL